MVKGDGIMGYIKCFIAQTQKGYNPYIEYMDTIQELVQIFDNVACGKSYIHTDKLESMFNYISLYAVILPYYLSLFYYKKKQKIIPILSVHGIINRYLLAIHHFTAQMILK